MDGAVRQLFHYPIKGLSPQPLERVALDAGRGFPFDRAFGFARHDTRFDPADPQPLPKQRFLMLMRNKQLAALETLCDPDGRTLSVRQDGREVLRCDLSSPEDVAGAEAFLARFLGLADDRKPVFIHSDGLRFTDASVASEEMMNAISLINLDSVQALGTRISAEIDPLRFRGNLYFDGWTPFAELDLIDREVEIGTARMRICHRIQRCAATEVNPRTAQRDLPLPKHLLDTYGHADMGVYALVLAGGEIRPGDAVRLL